MTINHKQQSQFELFPGTAGGPVEPKKRAGLFKDLTLAPENIIVMAIVFVMLSVLAFSFGVEKGRKVDVQSQEAHAPVNRVSDIVQSDQIPVTGEGRPSAMDSSAVQSQIVDANGVLILNVSEKSVGQEQNKIETPIQVPAPEAVGNIFTIQVASFKQLKYAQKEADKLKGKGLESFVISKGNYSIVCVGKFDRQDTARKFSNKLKNRYNDCLVRRF